MEHKKQSRKRFHEPCIPEPDVLRAALYQNLLTHSRALKSLQKYYKDMQEREKTLADILSTLKGGYNPNYQDMAVLEAVRGWDAYNGDDKPEGAETSEEAAKEEQVAAEDTSEIGEWTEDQIEHQLDALITRDYESLLIEHDEHMALMQDADGSVCTSSPRCARKRRPGID